VHSRGLGRSWARGSPAMSAPEEVPDEGQRGSPGGLDGAGAYPFDRAGGRRRPSRRDRGGHRERAGRLVAGGPTRHGAARGPGPDPVGHREQPGEVAEPQDHRRPVARQPAQAGQQLRCRHRRRHPLRRRGHPARRAGGPDVPGRAGARRPVAAGTRRASLGGRRGRGWLRGRRGASRERARSGTRAGNARRGDPKPERTTRVAARPGPSAERRRHGRHDGSPWDDRDERDGWGERGAGTRGRDPALACLELPRGRRSGIGPRARPCRRGRAADGPAGRRDLRGGRPPSAAARPTGSGQDHAGRAPAHATAPAGAGRRARGHRDPLDRGDPAARRPAADRAAVLRAAPHVDQGGDRRRRHWCPASGRGLTRTPGIPVPG
jgi:hypothetical protein